MPPEGDASVLDYEVQIEDQTWHTWASSVPRLTIDPSKVTDSYVVIDTIDTARHQNVLGAWLSEHRPFLLCGPPGSGKTMTL
jgi:dynein heavy chain 1